VQATPFSKSNPRGGFSAGRRSGAMAAMAVVMPAHAGLRECVRMAKLCGQLFSAARGAEGA